MTKVFQTDSYLSIADVRAQQYAAAGRKTRSFEETTLDGISRTDPKKAETLKKQLDDAKQVIAQLRTGKSNARQSRKTDAAEKIKRIQEQIKMLKLMGGDPKMIARQIAQLARELGSAAREYAAASADGASSQDNAANTSGDNTTMPNIAESDRADNGAAETVTASVVTVSGEPAATGEKEEKDGSTSPAAASTASTGVALDKVMQQYQEVRRQKINDNVQRLTAEIRQKTAAANADRQFAQDVRTLAALLKALARQQEQRLHKAGDHTADQELNQTSRVLAEAEKSVSGMVAPGMTAMSAIIIA
jgi:hypothetical protein